MLQVNVVTLVTLLLPYKAELLQQMNATDYVLLILPVMHSQLEQAVTLMNVSYTLEYAQMTVKRITLIMFHIGTTRLQTQPMLINVPITWLTMQTVQRLQRVKN
jgi:hypothetical protein